MVLEVIGAGFGRTGTLSLKTALERLGFGPCYHMIELMRHAEHIHRWETALAGRPCWKEVFAGYRATVDWPGVSFWRSLVDAYPEAKVILTVRDPQRWHASVRNTFLSSLESNDGPTFLKDAGLPAEDIERLGQVIGKLGFREFLHDEESAVAEFERHAAEVRKYVASDRLLVYEVSQGWEPLCEFLGVEAPAQEPFPRLNDSASFSELIPRLVAGDPDEGSTR